LEARTSNLEGQSSNFHPWCAVLLQKGVLYPYLYTTTDVTVIMRTQRLARRWSGIAVLAVAAGACATANRLGSFPGDPGPSPASRFEMRRQARDSAVAQRIADEVGPRVSIRATFENVAGSRHVDATFHLYDDAYVIVGHLDATGRLRIVFPLSPGDDGLIQGNKVYRVRPFFAGFVDEYRWNYSSYRYRYHSYASQLDSYDAGLGYVFVIASWRPMRLDRITDGDRWQSYEISDANYMVDPREAIEELGGVLAGDNREAYTIEYARYTTTNYGTYSLSAIRSCYGLGFSSFDMPPFGFGVYGFSPFGYSLSPCGGSSYGLGYRRYAWGYPVGGYTVPTAQPPVNPIPFRVPGTPITRRPQGADGAGAAPPRRPRQEAGQVTGEQGNATANAGIQSRHRGLIAEDAGGDTRAGQNTRRITPENDGTFHGEPRLQDMVGRRRIDDEIRGGRTNYGNDGSRRADQETRGFGDGASRASGTFRGGVTREPAAEGRRAAAPSGESGGERPARSAGGGNSSPRTEGSSGGSSRPAAPARAEPSSPPPRTSSPPSPPPRSEPASSSSSGERRKPGA